MKKTLCKWLHPIDIVTTYPCFVHLLELSY